MPRSRSRSARTLLCAATIAALCTSMPAFAAGTVHASRPALEVSAPGKVLATIAQALASAHSYQVTYSANSTQHPPAIERTTYTVVRRGSLRIDRVMALRPSGAGQMTIVEDVVQGTRVCERLAYQEPLLASAAFTCSVAPTTASGIAAEADPSKSFAARGATFTLKPATTGAKTIAGTRCSPYAFTFRSPTEHSTGTLYVAMPSGRPCEEDAIVLGPAIGPTTSTARQTLHTQWVWQHFNDTHLAIPATPAS